MSAVGTISLVSGGANCQQQGAIWFWVFQWCNKLWRQRIWSTKLFAYTERWNHTGPKPRTRIKPAAEWAPQDLCQPASISHIQSVNISVCELSKYQLISHYINDLGFSSAAAPAEVLLTTRHSDTRIHNRATEQHTVLIFMFIKNREQIV